MNVKDAKLEFFVGIFILIGFFSFAWMAYRLGEVPWLSQKSMYVLYADFENVSGVKPGSDVQVSGVTVGKVAEITLAEDDMARAKLKIDRRVKVPVDSVASVKSQGIIGDKFIQLTLGGDEELYSPEDVIVDTESALDIESLISNFAFGKVE